MAIFGDSVSRETYEAERDRRLAVEAQLDQSLARYDKLVDQIIDLKRHDYGMNPVGFDPATLDPSHGLGVQTMAAVEEFAGGDPELRRYLVGVAWSEHNRRAGMDAETRDAEIAALIMEGDQ